MAGIVPGSGTAVMNQAAGSVEFSVSWRRQTCGCGFSSPRGIVVADVRRGG